jgi:hypothetical protein
MDLSVLLVPNRQFPEERGTYRIPRSHTLSAQRGRTKTIITVDLEYRAPNERATRSLPPRSAVYFTYRNRLIRDEQIGEWQREVHVDVEDQHFRTHDSAAPAGSMRLLLSDFCPNGILSGTNDRTIAIIHVELANLSRRN